jgi:hypothetical protein
MRRMVSAWTLSLSCVCATGVAADISFWQIGGSGISWADSDSAQVMIDFATGPNSIQPVQVSSDTTVFTFLHNWSPKKNPDELGFVDGERPRAWKGCCGTSSTVDNALNLIDGSGATYNPVTSNSINSEYYTIDLGVPVPLFRFAMSAPDAGFYRSDGTPLEEDAIPAFEVSIAPDTNNDVLHTSNPIGDIITEARENVNPKIATDFSKQYVRYVRYKRKNSILDAATNQSSGHSGTARKGTVAEFFLWGEGIPKRATYKTAIFDLGEVVNFGRLFWKITPMRVVDRIAEEAPDAKVWVEVEARTGIDAEPDVYYEFTDMGTRVVVEQDRYQGKLKNQSSDITNADGLGGTLTLTTRPKPGIRAGIEYDQDNWTFWSFPTTASGQPLNLNRGSHLQLKLVLHSERFNEFARLDSLWIETSPILASRILGEVAQLEQPRPARGVAEVPLGELTDFSYDLKADFAAGEPGFNALRISTGSVKTTFKGLEIDGVAVDPAGVEVIEGNLVVRFAERISGANNPDLRVIFASEVFDFARTFQGEVFNQGSGDLAQPIQGGDVNSEVSTNSLRVLASSSANPQLVQNLDFSSGIVTPNGDGVNDELVISYSLYALPQFVPVQLQIFGLDGRQVARVAQGQQGSGPQTMRWDGRDERGAVLTPGIYLIGVGIESENKSDLQLQPIAIAY